MPQGIEDVSILDEDLLWRRILDDPTRWWTKNPDGTIRPSSSSFLQRKEKDSDKLENGLSVQLSKLTTQKKASSFIESAGLAEIEVNVPRELNLDVIYDPIEEDIAHTLISPKENQKITKAQARKLAGAVKMIVLPKSQRQ